MNKPNLELDIKNSSDMVNKIRQSDSYAQNLYAALCNQTWQRQDVFDILRDETWSCTWRYAGGIIADIRCEGSYLDWYCSGSGIWTGDGDVADGYVNEGVITQEIQQDMSSIGWHLVEKGEDVGF